jgi:TolB-like protein/cytochrome c-type biogenesis protein CcmH/NrfG
LATDNDNSSFFAELKRRNVYRVGVAYAIATWLLLQIIDIVEPIIGLPEWVPKLILTLLAVGLPIALIFAWAYELTPEGLKREKDVDRSQSITGRTGRRLDFVIIGVLVFAVAVLSFDKFLSPDSNEIIADVVVEPTQSTPSIAVLPFVNMSADADSGYFSDGLSDTLLHMLAQVRELRVAARTSSFQFRDLSMGIDEIGKKLNVSAILEGSVQRSGDKIRVTAQLIDVSNGFHLWSGNFDRDLDNVFEIQDEIANEVVAALKVSLLGEATEQFNRDQTQNFDAYTEYLLAINDLAVSSTESLASAVRHLQEAIRLDPEYARAYATLGRAYLALEYYGAMRRTQATAAARGMAARALDYSAESSEALAVLGRAEFYDGNREAAEQLLHKAIEIGPNDTVALDYYADFLSRNARPDEAVATYRQVLRLDPLSENAHLGLAIIFGLQQRFSEASETIARLKDLNPMSPNVYWFAAANEWSQGNLAAAIAPIDEAFDRDPNDPEGPALTGLLYLALDMPAEASRSFDRAVEMNAEHPMARSAPIFLNYYLQQNEDDNLRLARTLLEDRIDNRRGAQSIALIVLMDHAAKTGRSDSLLAALDNLYPHLFDDPPHKLDKEFGATFFVGWALMQSGDIERGSHLIQSYLDLREPFDEVYSAGWQSVGGRLLLGDTDGALEKLAGFAKNRYRSENNRFVLEHSSLFDPLRDEPAFIALLDEYRENAEEQRQILQAMNRDVPGS